MSMDILEKIELYIGEEISGSPSPEGGSPGTTSSNVTTYHRGKDVINKKKKKKSDGSDKRFEKEDSVKSGSRMINSLGIM